MGCLECALPQVTAMCSVDVYQVLPASGWKNAGVDMQGIPVSHLSWVSALITWP